MALLYPREGAIDGIQRIALSLGLSIAVVTLIGLALNYSPWGVRLESLLYSTAGFILLISIVTRFRRNGLPEGDRFRLPFTFAILGKGRSLREKTLTAVVAVTVVVALGLLAYVVATPNVGQQFTEFYILDEAGEARSYPRHLAVGEAGVVTVGIVNNEYEVASYRVEVLVDGVPGTGVDGITLEHGGIWEGLVSIVPLTAGENLEAEVLLYRDGVPGPYRGPLRLWIDVTE